MAASYYTPPFEQSSARSRESFAFESTVKRWPQILTSAIDTLHKLNYEFDYEDEKEKEKRDESVALMGEIARLKHEIGRDKEITDIDDDGEPTLELYNELLALNKKNGKGTWFTGDWLYNECYLYRRVRSLFARSMYWKTFDPFAAQKNKAFQGSGEGVYELASSYEILHNKLKTGEANDVARKAGFLEMAQVCLWGNATDLSLLTNMTADDIKRLQRTGNTGEGNRMVLANDLEKVWIHLSSLGDARKGRLDFVLDNAGFELYSDLIFADFLISHSFTDRIIFHPKLIPYFVSDVTPPDFSATFKHLKDPSFFASSFAPSLSQQEVLSNMVSRWESYLSDGRWTLSVPIDTPLGGKVDGDEEFWISPLPFGDIPTFAPKLAFSLASSDLVIFKGDLNYRKLTSDAYWPTTTPFEVALGPLAKKFPILALRTCKADVCVGLPEGKETELNEKDPSWRISGKYGVMQFCGKS